MFKNHLLPFFLNHAQVYFSLMNDICLSLVLPKLEYLMDSFEGNSMDP